VTQVKRLYKRSPRKHMLCGVSLTVGLVIIIKNIGNGDMLELEQNLYSGRKGELISLDCH
jgi:hypothetical protein